MKKARRRNQKILEHWMKLKFVIMSLISSQPVFDHCWSRNESGEASWNFVCEKNQFQTWTLFANYHQSVMICWTRFCIIFDWYFILLEYIKWLAKIFPKNIRRALFKFKYFDHNRITQKFTTRHWNKHRNKVLKSFIIPELNPHRQNHQIKQPSGQ